jgi:hypothetical protein
MRCSSSSATTARQLEEAAAFREGTDAALQAELERMARRALARREKEADGGRGSDGGGSGGGGGGGCDGGNSCGAVTEASRALATPGRGGGAGTGAGPAV